MVSKAFRRLQTEARLLEKQQATPEEARLDYLRRWVKALPGPDRDGNLHPIVAEFLWHLDQEIRWRGITASGRAVMGDVVIALYHQVRRPESIPQI